MERLNQYTQELVTRRRHEDFDAYLWTIAKHTGHGKSLSVGLRELERDRATARNLIAVVKGAVEIGTTTSTGWASELVPYAALTGDWVRSVSATTLLGQLATFRVPFDARVIVDGSTPAGGWVAEGQPIPMTRSSLTATPALPLKKVAAMIGVNDELLTSMHSANLSALGESASRNLRFNLDKLLVDPTITATTARPASLTNGIVATTSTGATALLVMADLRTMLQALLTDGSPDFSRVSIAMGPTTAMYLSSLLTTSGQFAFPALGLTGGSIWGIPTLVSKAAAGLIAVVDGSRILVADDGFMTVDVSSQAALQFSDAPSAGAASSISLFQTSTTVLRLVRYVNYQRATAGCVAWMTVAY